MLTNAPWNKYLWVNDIDCVPEAFTLSIIAPGKNGVVRESAWVAAQFNATTRLEDMSAKSASDRVVSDAEDFDDSSFSCGNWIVQVLECPGYCLALEVNGWDGISESVCARLSSGGSIAGSYYQSVNMDMLCTLARDGVVERTFDPLLTRGQHQSNNERDLPFGDEEQTESIVPAVFLLLERHTGISIEPYIFDGQLLWKTYQKTT